MAAHENLQEPNFFAPAGESPRRIHPPTALSAYRFSRHNSLIWSRRHKQSGTISLSPGRMHGGAVRSES